MTEKQIEYGFWYWDKTNNFPPDSITYPDQYKGQSKLNIACSQIFGITPTQQKKLVKEWVDFLPNCKDVEMLWFTTRLTQELFESVCKLKNLIGLNIKWSSIQTLDNILKLTSLKYLGIGSSAKVESIKPLTTLTNLEVLDIENFKKIRDFSPLSNFLPPQVLTAAVWLLANGQLETSMQVLLNTPPWLMAH